jgi:hypothetical protein
MLYAVPLMLEPALGAAWEAASRDAVDPDRVGESIATERCPNSGDSARVHHRRARVLCA